MLRADARAGARPGPQERQEEAGCAGLGVGRGRRGLVNTGNYCPVGGLGVEHHP